MNRVLTICVLVAFAFPCSSKTMGAEVKAKPNVIIIYSDDHGYTDLGIHGIDGNVDTPNMDAFLCLQRSNFPARAPSHRVLYSGGGGRWGGCLSICALKHGNTLVSGTWKKTNSSLPSIFDAFVHTCVLITYVLQPFALRVAHSCPPTSQPGGALAAAVQWEAVGKAHALATPPL